MQPIDRQTDVDRIANRAQEIYETKFQSDYEPEHLGKFVAIDIREEKAYLGEFAEDALGLARKEAPYGVFHLIRIGSPGAFRIRHVTGRFNYW